MRKLLLVLAIFCCFTAAIHAQSAAASGPPSPNPSGSPLAPAPVQPIPFNHKLHVQTAKMTCNDCHAPRGDGSTVAMPQASKCMTCHNTVDAGNPDIQRLAAAAKNEDPIAWVRVYRVPSFVTFSHKTHAASKCEACHGPVAERTAIALEKDTHMGTCIACHAANQAPTSCDTCHAIQSRNGHSPFDVDPAILARIQLASARSGVRLPLSSGDAHEMRQFTVLSTFFHIPTL